MHSFFDPITTGIQNSCWLMFDSIFESNSWNSHPTNSPPLSMITDFGLRYRHSHCVSNFLAKWYADFPSNWIISGHVVASSIIVAAWISFLSIFVGFLQWTSICHGPQQSILTYSNGVTDRSDRTGNFPTGYIAVTFASWHPLHILTYCLTFISRLRT